MFHLFTGNDLALLSMRLFERFEEQKPHPFQKASIVVQSEGMASWLKQRLAEHFGIWTHSEFPFPDKIIQRSLSAMDERPLLTDNPYHKEALTWRIFSCLSQHTDGFASPRLKKYISQANDKKLMAFSSNLARLFDQYSIYRPELLVGWEKQSTRLDADQHENAWQGALWKHVAEQIGQPHPSLVLKRLLDDENTEFFLPEDFPNPLFFFGMSKLPPLYLRLLSVIAQLQEVDFYLLAPKCPEVENAPHDPRIENQPADHHPLLRSMNKLGRDFMANLRMMIPNHVLHPLFEKSKSQGRLGSLQNDFYSDQRTPSNSNGSQKSKNIQIHTHASRKREVEQIKNQILDELSEDATLEPRDFLVMTPDIDSYAPLIESVFGRSGSKKDLAYQIADRSLDNESPAMKAFLELLALLNKKLTGTEVLDFMQSTAVMERFGMDRADLETYEDWVLRSEIRWGIDEGHRLNFGYPQTTQNSWQFGLNRLLLGVAFDEEEDFCFEGVVPIQVSSQEDQEKLGRLTHCLHGLFKAHNLASRPKTAEEWCLFLPDLMDQFVHFSPNERGERVQLVSILDDVRKMAAQAGVEKSFDLRVMTDLLKNRLNKTFNPHRFLAQGITFCGFMPMRSIPFRIIFLLGMNEESFPRKNPSSSLDLMRGDSKPGDPDGTEEDRFLFLEALLSAKQKLVISYVDRDLEKGSPKNPSLLVQELMDYFSLSNKTGPEPLDETAEDCLLPLVHPDFSFDPAYFDPNNALGRYGFSEVDRNCASILCDKPKEPPFFFDTPLPEPKEPSPKTLEITELFRFFRDPLGYLLKTRLGIDYWEKDAKLADLEPVEWDPLERFGSRQAFVETMIAQKKTGQVKQNLKNIGRLPFGSLGENLAHKTESETRGLILLAEELDLGAIQKENREFNLDLGQGIGLMGNLGCLRTQKGEIMIQPSSLKGKRILEIWLRHLLACNESSNPEQTESYYLYIKDKQPDSFGLRGVQDPLKHLGDLNRIYYSGIHNWFPFFPEASFLFAKESQKGIAQAFKAANKSWNKKDGGEAVKDVNQLIFPDLTDLALLDGERRPQAGGFSDLAKKIFGPVLEHELK